MYFCDLGKRDRKELWLLVLGLQGFWVQRSRFRGNPTP